MSLRYAALCLLAIFVLIFLAFRNYETWTSPLDVSSERAAPKKVSPKPEAGPAPGEQKDQKPASPSIASYIFIAEKNPFHPDRKEFPIPPPTPTAGTEPKKPPLVRPQVTLYGVTISGDYRSASLSVLGRPLQKGEREVMTVKIGDRVGEYKVAAISEDRVKLDAHEDNFEVFLYDTRNPKKRVVARTEMKPASVTSTAPGPPEPAKPGAPVPPGGPAVPGTAPGMPIQPGVVAAPMPVPVTPAGIPAPASPRSRRFFGPRTPASE